MPAFKTKLEKGGNMLVDTKVRGEIMAIVVTWLALNQDNHDLVTNGHDSGHSVPAITQNDCFIMDMAKIPGDVLVELAEAANHLKLWSLSNCAARTLPITSRIRLYLIFDSILN